MGRAILQYGARRYATCPGYTLPELLIALAVIGILVQAGLGLGDLVTRQRQAMATIELQRLIQFARSQAVTLQREVVLCALDENRECHRDWSGRAVAVFIDADRDRRLDEGEELQLSQWPRERGSLQWRASLGRPFLAFSDMGSTDQNGSFIVCYGGEGQRPNLVLSLNRGGRPYINVPGRRRCPG